MIWSRCFCVPVRTRPGYPSNRAPDRLTATLRLFPRFRAVVYRTISGNSRQNIKLCGIEGNCGQASAVPLSVGTLYLNTFDFIAPAGKKITRTARTNGSEHIIPSFEEICRNNQLMDCAYTTRRDLSPANFTVDLVSFSLISFPLTVFRAILHSCRVVFSSVEWYLRAAHDAVHAISPVHSLNGSVRPFRNVFIIPFTGVVHNPQ